MKVDKLLNFMSFGFVAPTPAATPETLDCTSKGLLLAADMIEFWGWTQYKFRSITGRMCAAQAIMSAAEKLEEEFGQLPIYSSFLMEERVRKILGEGTCIPGWNDVRGRTKEEVISTLREAAKLN